jgi:hypothetical protein
LPGPGTARRLALLGLLVLPVACVAGGGLVARGRRSLAELGQTPLAWTVWSEQGAGRSLVTDVVVGPEGRSWSVRLERDGDTKAPRPAERLAAEPAGSRSGTAVPLLSVVERGGLWWVDDGRRTARYRPFEAPLALPLLYAVLLDALPRAPSEAELEALGEPVVVTEETVSFRAEPGPEARRAAAEVRSAVEARLKTAEPRARAALESMLRAIEAVDAEGIRTDVDLERGWIVFSGAPGRRRRLDGPRTPEAAAPVLDAARFVDRSAPLAADRPDDLALIGHCGAWRPSRRREGCDDDAMLLDVATGALRRVAHRGAYARAVGFGAERRSVIVLGLEPDGDAALFEIDLDTGSELRLARLPREDGVVLRARVAPDGARLALLRVPDGQDVDRAELWLLEGGLGGRRLLGPAALRHFAWMADGSGLLVERVERERPDEPGRHEVLAVELDGTIGMVRPGRHPVALADGSWLLRDGGDRRWWRVAGDGSRSLVGDGLARLRSPSLSPDGDRLLMIAESDGGPRPVLVDLATGATRPATTAPGLWSDPVW